VGKTTLARIFAKAVNCENGPAAEPCNQCRQCRQITAGAAVDVVEIDAASNRGIDEARRLKEDIGYAPIDARYKVFIIDEAHMLTTPAFNALLKTLEEPPSHATFVLATTEPHKILPTIVSRCQHFVFQRLTQPEIAEHLRAIMEMEQASFEEPALRLIAKRAAGSVRDSMSLLGQVLALGGDKLTESEVRQVLGLAGQEIFQGLASALLERDLAAISNILRAILDQGLDLGFFLRELGLCFRNMFIISRLGDAAEALLELTSEEFGVWKDLAARMHEAHIHACWQMALEGQRKVLTSLEPGLALELLLLNLALMPELAAIEELPSPTGGSGSSTPQGSAPRGPTPGKNFEAGAALPNRNIRRPGPGRPSGVESGGPANFSRNAPHAPSAAPASDPGIRKAPPAGHPAAPPEPDPEPEPAVADNFASPEPTSPSAPKRRASTFEGLLHFIQERNGEAQGVSGWLRGVKGTVDGDRLELTCSNDFIAKQLADREAFAKLRQLSEEHFGRRLEIKIAVSGDAPPENMQKAEQIAKASPVVQAIQDTFDIRTMSVEPRRGGST
jgi:DNA polymerase-3 subunit gamma/tau